MSELHVPAYLQDAKQLLSETGFAVNGTWYHGTASGLTAAIEKIGLRGSGDLETLSKHFETLGTIGHDHSTAKDPLFITQSKTLAYFWAVQKTHTRNRFYQTNEKPVVWTIQLTAEQQPQVITDAGGAALLLEPNNKYITWLKEIYQETGLALPDLNPFSCDRLDYLNKLGLAYTELHIAPEQLQLLKD